MQLVTFEGRDGATLGVLSGERIIAISDLVDDALADMIGLINAGQDVLDRVKQRLQEQAPEGVPFASTKLHAPIINPGKFVCLGLNYAEHAKEGGRDVPEFPTLFLRTQTSLLPPGGEIQRPPVSTKLDYEAELLIVIGKTAKSVSEADALDYVFGYSAFNDGTIRDYQKRTSQWTAGKNFDATGPYGPVIVTADAMPAGASGLTLRSKLNGEVMQDGNTADMVFSVARIIANVSEIMTLHPGDMIATGTPSGVGFARSPQVFMKAGDVIEIEVEGMPTLVNTVVDA